MNTVSPIGVNTYNGLNFKSKAKKAGTLFNNAVSKSGEYQVYVDKLMDLQREIENNCYLLRQIPHTWCDPSSVSAADRPRYDKYLLKIKQLINEKKKVIAEMIDPLLRKEKYRYLPKDYRERIINNEEAGSTWKGYYFNEKELDQRIADMIAWDREAPIREQRDTYDKKKNELTEKLQELYNSQVEKRRKNRSKAMPFPEWAEFVEQWRNLITQLREVHSASKADFAKIDELEAKTRALVTKYG